MNLITMNQARFQLSIIGNDHDQNLEDLRLRASDIIRDYLEQDGGSGTDVYDWLDSAGEPVNVPPRVQQATLLVMSNLWYDREGLTDPISDAVISLLNRIRQPTIY